jgi:hypothetical protein
MYARLLPEIAADYAAEQRHKAAGWRRGRRAMAQRQAARSIARTVIPDDLRALVPAPRELASAGAPRGSEAGAAGAARSAELTEACNR